MQARALDQLENQYHKNDKPITNLFQENLKKLTTTKETSFSLALSSTQQTLNQKYQCTLTREEINSFIYINDKEIKNHLDHLYREDWEKNKPDRQKLMAEGCLKLSKCINPKALNPSEQISKCSDIIMSIYTPQKQATDQQQRIQTSNLWNNKYQNWDTQDASYDLLHDISKVGSILFKGFKTPPEIIFYAAPNFNVAWNSQSKNNGNTSYTTSTGNTNWTLPSQNTKQSQWWTTNTQNTTTNTPTEDEEINQFLSLWETFLTKNQNDEILFLNQCLPLNTTKIKNPDSNKETPSVSDSLNTQGQKGRGNDTDLTKALQNLEKITNPNIPSQTGLSNMTTNFPGKTQEESNACIAKCESRDKNGNYNLAIDERLICKLQCLCGEYISPALPKGADFPILNEAALRLRFCTVPAKAVQVDTTSKSIYSISEVIQEVQGVFTNLNLGWRLTTREQKTEFLDSDLSHRSLSKNAAIITNLAQKQPTNKTSQQDKKTDNENMLKALERDTQFWRNSFIVTGLPQSTIASSVKSNQLPSSPDLSTETIKSETILYRNNLANLNLQLAEFLSINEAFLAEFHKKLKEMNSSLNALYTKKQ